MRRGGLYALFFLSGVSALVYELVWQRLLNLVFGVSTLSVSAVLAAFMGGLALGGLLLGRAADRSRRPLRLYAWLEGGIGLAALLVIPGFTLLTSVYTGLHAWLQPGQWTGACLRFVMALLVLGLPATLIGATLPVMGRLAVRRDKGLPATFSLLYAVNTLGAVVGAGLTGFLLLQYLGMQQTLWLAVGVNFLVALGAMLLDLRAPILDPPPAAVEPSSVILDARGWLALSCAAVTGATSMGFEVAWARILGILTSNSAYGFALLLTVLLLGLGVGSLLQWAWSLRPGDAWGRLAVCQWFLAGITVATLPFFHAAPEWLVRWCEGGSPLPIFLGELALTAGALFLPAVCMGMSLPLLIAGVTSDPDRFGQGLGRIYAINTLGAVVGAFTTGFVLVPWVGIQTTMGAIIASVLLVGCVAWGHASRPALGLRFPIGVLMLFLAGSGWILIGHSGYHKSVVREPRQLLYYREGHNATVAVVQEANGTRSIMVDGQPVAGTGATSVIDQKMLAHLPLMLHPSPQRALTVGFGSGGTSYSMSLHGIDVDCVEIEGAVPAAAGCFESENHGVRSNPRYRVILDDARSWLRVADVRYDVIATDCTNIQYRSNGDLYTVDYFALLRDRLTADGVAAAWVPANGIEGADLKTLLRSFQAVFPHTSIWYMNTLATDFLIVIGTPGEPSIDLDCWRERMRRPGIEEDLARVGLADPCRLAYTILAGEDELSAYLGAGPCNTDDRPVLSYSTYGAGFRSTIAANLLRLAACRRDVARWVRHPAAEASMMRHFAASNEAILGHIAHLAGADDQAAAHYVRGALLLPGDPALEWLSRMAQPKLSGKEPAGPASAPSLVGDSQE